MEMNRKMFLTCLKRRRMLIVQFGKMLNWILKQLSCRRRKKVLRILQETCCKGKKILLICCGLTIEVNRKMLLTCLKRRRMLIVQFGKMLNLTLKKLSCRWRKKVLRILQETCCKGKKILMIC